MDREAWRAAVYGVAKCRPQMNNWTELNSIILTLDIKVPLNLL